ncbi:hypothetical protein PRIPAC_88336, partial [Pristionchus pacificus]|uniref:Uncharacterized protein n=1 Tax=Pristionchus pacificus TaxID=54126 RepID=A0A2A6CW56_PRIPA
AFNNKYIASGSARARLEVAVGGRRRLERGNHPRSREEALGDEQRTHHCSVGLFRFGMPPPPLLFSSSPRGGGNWPVVGPARIVMEQGTIIRYKQTSEGAAATAETVKSKFNDMRNSSLFKSFESKLGIAYTSAKMTATTSIDAGVSMSGPWSLRRLQFGQYGAHPAPLHFELPYPTFYCSHLLLVASGN